MKIKNKYKNDIDSKTQSWINQFIVYFVLLIFFLIINKQEIIYECKKLIQHYDAPGKALVYMTANLISTGAVFIAVFTKSLHIRIPFFILSFIGILINQTYSNINGNGMEYNDMVLLINNAVFAHEAVSFYRISILKAGILASFFIIICIVLRFIFPKIQYGNKISLVTILLSYFLCFTLINATTANRTSFADPVKLAALFTYTLKNNIYTGDRKPVSLLHQPNTTVKHIVWIVDESVRGDMLSINGYLVRTTPFLEKQDDKIINFGVASSGAICSDFSNIIMISGIRKGDIPDKQSNTTRNTSIFQYAAEAGFKTNFISGPSHTRVLEGFMTPFDLKEIDHLYFMNEMYKNVPTYEIDRYCLSVLKNITTDQEKSFTYLVKYGNHFNYENTYPKERKLFSPTELVNKWDELDKEKLLNSYYNSINWNVDAFFEKLDSLFHQENILVVYTSDHGQNLKDVDGIKQTHCLNSESPSQMAAVPLLLYSPNPFLINDILQNYQNPLPVNHVSHFEIFPTVLEFMGFERDEVQKLYGPNLFELNKNEKRVFSSGDLFGRGASFVNEFRYPF